VLSDDALIRAHRAGDGGAFGTLVERYRDRIYRLCYRLTFDKEDALDITQLTFWKAYRGLAEYDRVGGLYTWLYRIATNAAIDLLRERRRRKTTRFGDLAALTGRDGDDVSFPEPMPGFRRERLHASSPEDDPARVALRNELATVVAQAVSRLSPEHRATLLLRAGEGLSYREIAETLDCPVGTVMSRLHVARERVRQTMAGYLDEH
jgi:RNA polymerase sigma-70 factor, ECF subfamily